jgi:hypothetical protein
MQQACGTEPAGAEGTHAALNSSYPLVYRMATMSSAAIRMTASAVHKLATLTLETSPLSAVGSNSSSISRPWMADYRYPLIRKVKTIATTMIAASVTPDMRALGRLTLSINRRPGLSWGPRSPCGVTRRSAPPYFKSDML